MLQYISKRSISVFLAGLVGSCIVGFAAYGADIFNLHSMAFQFVSSGAVASALAAAVAVECRNAMWAIAGLSLLLFLAATRPSTGALLLRDLVYLPTLVAAVWLSGVVSDQLPSPRVGQVFAWGMVFAACHFAAFCVLTVANGSSFNPQMAYAAARIGGLVGVGVGLGIFFAGSQKFAAVQSAH